MGSECCCTRLLKKKDDQNKNHTTAVTIWIPQVNLHRKHTLLTTSATHVVGGKPTTRLLITQEVCRNRRTFALHVRRETPTTPSGRPEISVQERTLPVSKINKSLNTEDRRKVEEGTCKRGNREPPSVGFLHPRLERSGWKIVSECVFIHGGSPGSCCSKWRSSRAAWRPTARC